MLFEEGITLLQQLFQKSGYQTAAFGKLHLGVGHGSSWSEVYDWNRLKIEALRKTERLENTLILFTSESGTMVSPSERHAEQWGLRPMWDAYVEEE